MSAAAYDAAVTRSLAETAVPLISDALDMLAITGGLHGLHPVWAGAGCCGPAYTILFEPVEPGALGPAAEYVDEVPRGSVVLLGNGGRTDCTVWGGLLAAFAVRHGIAGTVIDGACRDLDEIARLAYPVFARDVFMRSGKHRVRMVAAEVEVTVGGITVRPGDVIRADGSGVIVIPRDRAAEVAEVVAVVADRERRIAAAVEQGSALREARQRYGYNELAQPRRVGAGGRS
jgi:4-hydroxy-4-methyl-2-oxoglutarate aldolase